MDKNGEAGGTPGEGFTLHTPDGWTYYFDRQTTEPVPALRKANDGNILPRSRFVMLASRVEDPFGNWVAYHYDSSGKLTSITANDGRKIEVNYNSDGKVGSVVANGKTWTYAYSNGLLYTVTLPDGREWKFNLSALAEAALYVDHPLDCTQGPGSAAPSSVSGTINGPYGTTVKFMLGAVRQGHADVPDDCLSDYVGAPGRAEYPIDYYTLALKSKTISGSNMASLTWTYQYSQTPGWYSDSSGATRKSVSVLDPDGGKTTYWFDIRLDWHEGNLDMIDYYLDASDSNYYRRVTNDYSLRDIQAGDSGVTWSNNERSRAIVRQSGQHIAQDGATYSWEVPNPDSDSSWDGYSDPLMRLEYNGSGQELEKAYTYENLRSAWWLGQVASVTIKAPSDVANLVPYVATFLPNGRISSVSKFGRLVGTYDWTDIDPSKSLLTKITDPAGYQTQLSNYYRGRPQKIIFADGGQLTLAVNGDGTIASVTNARGYTTNYTYDPLGRLKQITYPTNDIQSWDPTTFTLATCSYIPAGIQSGSLCRTETTGTDTETTYYDSLLRPVLTRKGSSYVNRQFDSAGHVTFESYPSTDPTASSGTQYFYDLLGRLDKVVRSTEDGDATESIAYGRNQKMVTDAKGNVTTYTYRNLGAPDDKLLMEIDAPESETTTIGRDGLGAMTSAVRSGGGVSETRSYIYDANRDLCMVVNPETGLTVMHYNSRGLMDWQATGVSSSSRDCASVAVSDSQKTFLTYDGKRRVTNIDYPGTTNDIVKTYDAEDNITSLENGSVTWTYGYNGRNLLTSGSLVLDGVTFTLGHTYNSRAQLTGLSYPETETVAFSPDAYGRPTQVGSVVSSVTYHPDDTVASYTYGNGNTMQMVENARDLPAQLAYSGVNYWDYGYDLNGNLTSAIWHGPADVTNDSRSGFSYDGLNRLRTVTGPWGTATFTYDALDNLLSKQYGSRGQTTYTYDADNRLSTISGGLSYTLGYDTRGNIIQRNDDTFTFDAANRMTASDKGGSYIYDGWGRRVKITAPSGEVTYTIYSKVGQLLQEYKPASAKRTDYLYLTGKLVAKVANLASGPKTAGALTVTGDTIDGNYTLSWSAVSGASRTKLVAQQSNGEWTVISDGTAVQKSFSNQLGGDYPYRVAGCIDTDSASAGCGASSPILTVGVAPTIPTLYVPTTTQNSGYTISWTAPVSATSYELDEYKNGTWSIVPNISGTSAHRDQVGGSYQYRVQASNHNGARGFTAPSTVVNVLPPTPATLGTNDSTAVDSRFTLTWGRSAGATSYRLRRRQQNSNGSWSGWSYYGATGSLSRDFAYHELGDGTYQFQVQAYTSGVGYSGWQGTPTVQVEWTPPAPSLSVPGNAGVGDPYTVSWSRPSGVATFHLQERNRSNSGDWSAWTTYTTTATSKTFMKSTGTYEYQVNGCKSFVCSGYSAAGTISVGSGACPTGTTTTNTTATPSTGTKQQITPNALPVC
ncbi:MAG TPA: hypothetical protein VFK24_07880 [Gammaproteobacteria bacterium]|nr:hypothetical protein [Gammaproteobacteria bacterium]